MPEEERIQPCLIGIAVPLDERVQDEPESEEGGEHESECAVVFDTGEFDDAENQQRANPPGHRGPEHENQRRFAAREQECQGDAWQCGVRDGIAEEALPPQNRISAERATDDSEQCRTNANNDEGVIKRVHRILILIVATFGRI